MHARFAATGLQITALIRGVAVVGLPRRLTGSPAVTAMGRMGHDSPLARQ
jgi:hypothetical protein